MKSSVIFLLIGGGIILWLLTKAQSIGSLNFVPRGLSTSSGAVLVQLGIQNPTSNQITLRSLVGSLIVNGSNVGDVSNFTTTTIQPNSETGIIVRVTPNYLGLASGLLNSIEDFGATQLTASLQGSANVEGQTLPLQIRLT